MFYENEEQTHNAVVRGTLSKGYETEHKNHICIRTRLSYTLFYKVYYVHQGIIVLTVLRVKRNKLGNRDQANVCLVFGRTPRDPYI